MKAKIAVGSSAVAWGPYASHPVDLYTFARRLVELGCDGIELFGGEPHGSFARYPTTEQQQALGKRLRELGLAVACYGVGVENARPAAADEQERARYRAAVVRGLDFTAALDCRLMRLDTNEDPRPVEGESLADDWARTVDSFRWAATEAEKRGVTIVWEYEPGFRFNKPSQVVRMLKEVEHPHFTALYDVCHSQTVSVVGARQPEPIETLSGGPIELAHLLSGHIGYVHLIDSDNTLHDNATSMHVPFGRGVVDMPAVVRALLEAGYRGDWWTVDLCFWPQAWEELEPAVRYVRDLLGRL